VVVEIARRRWASWGDSAAAEFVEGKPRSRARPLTQQQGLTQKLDRTRRRPNRLPETAWTPAYNGDGEPRDCADVADDRAAEPDRMAGAHPRHRPRSAAPGAQLRPVDHDGRRITCFPPTPAAGDWPTETAAISSTVAAAPKTASAAPKTLAWPTCRSTTRHLTRSGWPSFSSPTTRHLTRSGWIVLIAYDSAHLDPDAVIGAAAGGRPKTLRLRLLAIAGRLTRSGRRTQLRLDRRWPWAATVTAAVARCAPSPPG
jgi:hypothetical protein